MSYSYLFFLLFAVLEFCCRKSIMFLFVFFFVLFTLTIVHHTPISCSTILDCVPHQNEAGRACHSEYLLYQYGGRIVISWWLKSLKGIPYFDSSFIEKWLEKDGKVPKKVITRGYNNFCKGYIFDVEGKFQS